ncbi:hypothetical protein TNIN_323081, partial [Trichonephila inaurata madagascariensis]
FDIYTFWKNVKIVILELASPDVVEKANISTLVEPLVQSGFCYFQKKRKFFLSSARTTGVESFLLKFPKEAKSQHKTSTMDLYRKKNQINVIFMQIIKMLKVTRVFYLNITYFIFITKSYQNFICKPEEDSGALILKITF